MTEAEASPQPSATRLRQGKLSEFLSARKNPVRATQKRLSNDVKTPTKALPNSDVKTITEAPPSSDVRTLAEVPPKEPVSTASGPNEAPKRESLEAPEKLLPEKREALKIAEPPATIAAILDEAAPVTSVGAKAETISAEPLAIPAFERYYDLVSVPPAPKLHLPPTYSLLLRIHYALDSVCQLSAARDQPAVFHRIQKAVQSIIGRDVTIAHVRQINGLNPDAYVFRRTTIVHEGRKTQSFAISLLPTPQLSHSELVGRRQLLQDRLLSLVHAQHHAFLREISVKVPEGAKFKAWHPKFKLDAVSSLPEKELWDEEKPREEASQANIPDQVKEVIEEAERNSKASSPAKSVPRPEQPALAKKLSLLERIKAKEKEAEVSGILAGNTDDDGRRKTEAALFADLADNLSLYRTFALQDRLII